VLGYIGHASDPSEVKACVPGKAGDFAAEMKSAGHVYRELY